MLVVGIERRMGYNLGTVVNRYKLTRLGSSRASVQAV